MLGYNCHMNEAEKSPIQRWYTYLVSTVTIQLLMVGSWFYLPLIVSSATYNGAVFPLFILTGLLVGLIGLVNSIIVTTLLCKYSTTARQKVILITIGIVSLAGFLYIAMLVYNMFTVDFTPVQSESQNYF